MGNRFKDALVKEVMMERVELMKLLFRVAKKKKNVDEVREYLEKKYPHLCPKKTDDNKKIIW